MPIPIYIKLGTATQWDDERLNFHIGPAPSNPTAGILDFSNINDHIMEGLNAGEIIQIDAAEYYSIVGPTGDPIIINPPNLIAITEYQGPCPVNGFVMFGWYAGKWYKILWSTVKECVSGVAGGTVLRVRVGDPDTISSIDLPHDGDDSFINSIFQDKTYNDLFVTYNGVELPGKDLLDPSEYASINYYELNADSTTNKFKMNTNFATNDRLVVRII